MLQADLYSCLGVQKTSSQDEIKKAYHNLALRYHPDKNTDKGDQDKFKEISNAYDILSDPEKRKEYDRQNQSSSESNGNHQGQKRKREDQEFSNIWNAWARQGDVKNEKVEIVVDIELKDLYTGKEIMVTHPTKILCTVCLGSFKEMVETACEKCNAVGNIRGINRLTGEMMIKGCEHCWSTGYLDTFIFCTKCRGQNITQEKELGLFLPKGTTWEHIFVLEKGAGLLGDLYIELRMVNWNGFKKCRNDLYKKVTLTLHEALFGFNKVLFNHLDGRQIKCKHLVKDGVIKPGTFKCIRREGMPYSSKHDLRGDLYIEFEVDFPDNIIIPQPRECKDSDDVLSLVKSCFPEPVPMTKNDPVEECELHETSRTLFE